MNALTKPELQEIARRFHASSRAEGIENIRAVNGIQFYVTADAYRAAREEAGGEWRHGSDARWGYEAGVAQGQVTVLSRLYGADNNALLTSSSWSQAREAVSNLPPKDGRSTKTTVVVDGKETEGEVLSPEPERVTPVVVDAPSMLTPSKPPKAQLERQEWEAERAKERNEVCDILRKLPREHLFRLSDLHPCWMADSFEAAAEWLFVLAEIAPDRDWLGAIECSNLNTEENRQRLEQIKAASRNDANQRADLGAKVDQVVDDDPLVIPDIFKRGRTA
jgi:hypothetical protein